MNGFPAQTSLFDPSAPYRDVDTSIAAARVIAPHITKLHKQILDAIDRFGTRTVDEVCVMTGRCRNTIAPRFNELGPGTARRPGLNLIRDSGQRRALLGQAVKAIAWERNR